MWTRSELKTRGKAAFKRTYWRCVGVSAILTILLGIIAGNSGSNDSTDNILQNFQSSDIDININLFGTHSTGIFGLALIVSIALTLFVRNILLVGGKRFFIRNSEDGDAEFVLLFSVYKDKNFWNIFAAMFLQDLFLALWFLLLIVPGIIKSYSYRMVPYILSEEPELDPMAAITKSREMMNGNKWKAFVLDLSFIGWSILSVITLGLVGIFYYNPYAMATNAELYKAIR